MFKHILVPLDGSRLAEAALPVAAVFAKKLGAKVTFVHLIEKGAPGKVHGQEHLKDAESASVYLKDVSGRALPSGLQVDCHVHTAEVDNVAESIVEHARELGCDFIVMCSHGGGGALRMMLGSIAQKVISIGSFPVVVTHPGENGDARAFSCGALLVPFDGDVEHARALPIAKELARAFGATLHLAMVIPTFGTLSGQMTVTSRLLPGTTSRMLDMAVQSAEEDLRVQVEALRNQGLDATAHVLRGDPAGVIVEYAEQSEVDMIVLATHGRLGMDAFWEGSVANRVCSLCRVPLLLIPVHKS
jgi:nucleotide-binding universal stress UspA family protein